MSSEAYLPEHVREIFSRLRDVRQKKELADALACEVEQFDIMDLQRISASIERELDRLPSPYRENIHPYFMEQFFVRYFQALKIHGDGLLKTINGEIKDPEVFRKYCDMLAGRDWKEDDTEGLASLGPQYSGYYHLLSCLAMFVFDEPGHPVGMPFPGGFFVQRKGDVYYCPIREKEKDVPFSICNFCPARQSDLP
jgi:uncharacterized protein (UPF0305 family)